MSRSISVVGMEESRMTLNGNGTRSQILLGPEQGCTGACLAGVSVYGATAYPEPGVHDFQEGFYVISGRGYLKAGEEEYAVETGNSFLVPAGVSHTMRAREESAPLTVYWFHSA